MKWTTFAKLAIVVGLASMYAFIEANPVCQAGDGSNFCDNCVICWASSDDCGCVGKPAL